MAVGISNGVYEIRRLARVGYSGIIGVESAAGFWGLSCFRTNNPIMMVGVNGIEGSVFISDCGLSCLYVHSINTGELLRISEDNSKLLVTSKEQTIVDMVRFDRYCEFVYESLLSAYWDGMADIEKLESLAKEYGVLELMKEKLLEAKVAYCEDNGEDALLERVLKGED